MTTLYQCITAVNSSSQVHVPAKQMTFLGDVYVQEHLSDANMGT